MNEHDLRISNILLGLPIRLIENKLPVVPDWVEDYQGFSMICGVFTTDLLLSTYTACRGGIKTAKVEEFKYPRNYKSLLSGRCRPLAVKSNLRRKQVCR